MPQIEAGITKESLTTEIEIINQKRAALQKLVKLTNTLNRLHQGLQSVLLMGKSVSQIPDKIVDKFRSLSDRLESHATDTLKNTLSNTDLKIQSTVKHVLEVSQKSEAELSRLVGGDAGKLVANVEEDFYEYVNDFKKKSQTSIALRLALKARNVVIKAFNLPVPESFIEQQIHTLDKREAICREKIKTDIQTIQNDVAQLLHREDCPESLKQKLLVVQSNINENMAFINNNQNIEDMPILYENIELSAAPQMVDEVEVITQPEQSAKEAPKQEEKLQPVKRGFFSRLWAWMNSPLNVKWKDISKYK